MSHAAGERPRLTIPELHRRVQAGERLAMCTAYDVPTARIADAAGMDLILVGDSVGNVCLGFENTLPVTMAMMRHHLEAVARAQPRALLLADMPFLSYHLDLPGAIANAGAFIRAGAQGVKLEGGHARLPVVRALVDAEIPVMGHLGLTPQALHRLGGYRVQGREAAAAQGILEDARALQEAGCFAVLLECIPAELAARVTETLQIPTIGIGAGPACSGQVLVFHDVLGLSPGPLPRFVRTYLDGFRLCTEALTRFGEDVRAGRFPNEAESYTLPEHLKDAIQNWRPQAD